MGSDFDLDVTFDDVTAEADVSTIDVATLTAIIDQLPEALKPVATGLIIEGRTMSDVSQDLGIRQSELVTRLHRAKLAIAQIVNS